MRVEVGDLGVVEIRDVGEIGGRQRGARVVVEADESLDVQGVREVTVVAAVEAPGEGRRRGVGLVAVVVVDPEREGLAAAALDPGGRVIRHALGAGLVLALGAGEEHVAEAEASRGTWGRRPGSR